MPKIPVDECPAGPAMDAAVAKILGIERQKQWDDGTRPIRFDRQKSFYSTDIAAAWELVSWMHQRINEAEGGNENALPFDVSLYCRLQLLAWSNAKEWFASFDKRNVSGFSNGFACIAETAPLAICRAFLKANGVEHVEVME